MAVLYIAGCIITDDKGRLLLLHRNKNEHSHWEIPGGKIDPGEDPKATVLREAKEELGVDIKIVGLLGDKHCTETTAKGTFTNHFTWYRARIVGDAKPFIGEPKTFDDIGYLEVAKLQKMTTNISAAARDFVLEIADGRITL